MLQPILVSFGLAVLSAIIHALGLLGLLYWLTRQWPKIEADFRPQRNLPTFLILFGVILVLHIIEICVWAGAYFWERCLTDFETSFYFSGATYTALGYCDLALPRLWRLAGVMESLTGVLLLGWSAAFFFSVASRLFDLRIRHWR
jgi:voltage-gated potassium channel